MRPPKYSWPKTSGSRGILFFAQNLREMLTASTFESFRVYSLDTPARLREALAVMSLVERGSIPPAVLIPILDELEWSFLKDVAASSLAREEIDSLNYVSRNKSDLPVSKIGHHLRLIIKILDGKYKEKIECLIIDKFDKDNMRVDVRKLAGFYCSHVINCGYERRFVLDTVENYFFRRKVSRVGRATLSRFFREFDGKKRRFVVHAAVSDDLGRYLHSSGFRVREISRLTQAQRSSLLSNPNSSVTPLSTEITTDQLDPYGAVDRAFQQLSSQRAISFLDPQGLDCEWGQTMYVNRARSQAGVEITKGDFLQSFVTASKKSASGWRFRNIANYARRINSNFDEASTERLLSSINTAALARTTSNPENQLISLWSAIEVLLSEPRGGARILHYLDLVVPCIVLRHVRRQMLAVYNELLVMHRRKFRQIVRQIPFRNQNNLSFDFVEMLLLPEYEENRNELCLLLSDNPAALHRVWKLRRDYRTIGDAKKAIGDHYNRVAWQIHRIYRARNQLVHSGEIPSYLESVILNLAEYYRSATASVIRVARSEERASDIDQIVAEVGIRYRIMCKKLAERDAKSTLSSEDVSVLLDIAP